MLRRQAGRVIHTTAAAFAATRAAGHAVVAAAGCAAGRSAWLVGRLRPSLLRRQPLRARRRFLPRLPRRLPLGVPLRPGLRRPLRLRPAPCLLRLNVLRDRYRGGDGAIVPAELDGGVGARAGDGTEAVALPRDSSVARRVLGG